MRLTLVRRAPENLHQLFNELVDTRDTGRAHDLFPAPPVPVKIGRQVLPPGAHAADQLRNGEVVHVHARRIMPYLRAMR